MNNSSWSRFILCGTIVEKCPGQRADDTVFGVSYGQSVTYLGKETFFQGAIWGGACGIRNNLGSGDYYSGCAY